MSGKRFLYPDAFEACDYCRGRGTVYCSSCLGTGHREIRTRRPDASRSYVDAVTEREPCSLCDGSGQRVCTACGGTGDQKKPGVPDPTLDPANADAPAAADAGSPGGDEPPRSPEECAALYESKLAEAARSRDEIVAWIRNADAFTADYKTRITRWLGTLPLDDPAAADSLEAAAAQLVQPGLAAQARTLRSMLMGLSGTCSTVQLYRTMSSEMSSD